MLKLHYRIFIGDEIVTIIRYLVDALIPAITAYLANSDTLYEYLKKVNILSDKVNVATVKECFLIVNIVFTAVLLAPQIILAERRTRNAEQKIDGLNNTLKQFVQNNFVHITKNENFSFDMRIFVHERSIFQYIKKIFGRSEMWFTIRNITPFASKDITEHLRFRVDPHPQGLVGEAYAGKSIVYDENLLQTNSVDYALDQLQVNRTSKLLWSICVPILDDSNNVIAVMAFDSTVSKLNIKEHKEEIRTLTNAFAVMMHDSMPDLFKGKVRFKW